MTDFDPTTLDSWSAPTACASTVAVQAGSATLELHCELDGDHDEHEAALRWTSEEPA